MYLIDWEYSAMSDYASDLGTFICCSDYTYDEACQVFDAYFGRKATPEELRHCLAYVALASYCWFVWALYKESSGDPVGEWLYLWYRYAKQYSIALGMLAVDAAKSARFRSCAQLVFDLKAARERGRLDERYQELSKVDLLILDEFGYIPLDSDGGRLLFQVMSNCYERQSMVLTTNIEFGKWGTVLADDKLASALVDRIVHHGRLVEFKGESRRVADSLMLGNRKEG